MESIQKNNKYYMEQTATKKCPIDAQFTNKPKICQDFVAFVYQITYQHNFDVSKSSCFS